MNLSATTQPPVDEMILHPHRPHSRHGLPECVEQDVIPPIARVIPEFGVAMLDFAAADPDPRHAGLDLRTANHQFAAALLRVGMTIIGIAGVILHELRMI
jgi:hypothetical protein